MNVHMCGVCMYLYVCGVYIILVYRYSFCSRAYRCSFCAFADYVHVRRAYVKYMCVRIRTHICFTYFDR